VKPALLTFVLEDLNPCPPLFEFSDLIDPELDNPTDLALGHLRQREVMARRVAYHPADNPLLPGL
jgi:hypothetical protein